MNKFLKYTLKEKYYNVLTENEYPDDTRVRGEVYIIHPETGKICVGFNRKDNELFIPGGGVERGESISEATKREAMEEIGVKSKNLKLLKNPIKVEFEGKPTDYKQGKYKYMISYSYIATYDGMSEKIKEDDNVIVKHLTIPEAIEAFTNWRDKQTVKWRILLSDELLNNLKIINNME